MIQEERLERQALTAVTLHNAPLQTINQIYSCRFHLSSGNTGKQAPGSGEIGGGHLARGFAAGDQIDVHSVVGAEEQSPNYSRGCVAEGGLRELIGLKRTQIFFGPSVSG